MLHDYQRPRPSYSRFWAWATVILVVLLAALIRIHLLDAPFERDEGEYAYAGQLILKGIPPYAEVYNMKMPGIYGAYALIMAVFGQTHGGIHLGLLLINAATTVFLFLLVMRLYGPFTGAMAAACFAVLCLGQAVLGIFANAEHFVILPAVGGILLLVRAVDSGRKVHIFLSGLLLGVAFIMKQHGAAFIAFGGLYLFLSLFTRRLSLSECVSKFLLFSAGAVVPFGLTCLILLWAGVFERFWFWTFLYASKYVSSVPLSTGLGILKKQITPIVDSSVLIWALAGVGLTALVWDKQARTRTLFVSLFSIFSFLAVCPGFYFRPHYFILLLPAIALLAAIGMSSVGRLLSDSTPVKKGVPVLLAAIALSHSLYANRLFLFQASPSMATRMAYDLRPFPESIEVARYIEEHSSEDDRIAVIGSEPQIYFYSKRLSATGYIYTYALMEEHDYALKMQKEMITEIYSTGLKYIIGSTSKG
jgi:4-amino-4-deoxy-L-arabinose transferase-like glycosyltransferase